MGSPYRILYVGQLDAARHNTATQRMLGLEDLGHELVPLDSQLSPEPALLRQLRRVRRKLFRVITHPSLDREILEQVESKRPDILWIDKGDSIDPRTLASARKLQPDLRIVGFCPDDMMNPDNKTRFFVECLPHYDIYFTTKSFAVPELKALGCPKAVFVDNSYDPTLHRPIELTAAERERLGSPVGFIGFAEGERAESVAALGRAGIPVKVWGNGWAAYRKCMPPSVDLAGPCHWGEDYAKVINSFDINLAFLRKCNRDLQTTRTMEIPACGKMMLAERTNEHRALFEEGVEAEFFGSDEELLKKTRYYLDHPEERERIAAAGRRRCVEGGHSNQERLESMLETLEELR